MQLIGKRDSPYVRRVAIAMTLMDLPFSHADFSVFGDFERFKAVNPVVKAPTLVTDNGVVLMDSAVIIEYLERLAPAGASVFPDDPDAYLEAQRITALALAACEKTVHIIYEQRLRPAEKQHQPWLDRVTGQLLAAYTLLDAALVPGGAPWLFGTRMTHADVIAAVAWRFTQDALPGLVPMDMHPRITAHAAKAEAEAAFKAVPPI